jgi:plastocyanin
VSHLIATRARTPRLVRGVTVLAVALASLTACSGSDGGGSAGGTGAASATSTSETAAPISAAGAEGSAQTQSITATEADFSIALGKDSLPAGTYDITVVNDGHATHDLVVERNGADVAASDTIAPGASTTVNVALEPGTYVFYCSIGNHRAMGMELTVTVT